MGRLVGIILAFCMTLTALPQLKASAEVRTSASACILIEAVTGRVLYAENAEEKLPMASTTKIMTVLLTLESGNLDEEFSVDNDAIHVEGSSMGLQENDIVTKRALCYGMLLPSGNDAANAAAVAVGGSIPAFAEMMNARAQEIGMTRSFFVTPSGLEGIGHGASAHDMARLTREALQNPAFCEICSQSSAVVRFGNPPSQRTLYNTNKLLTMCEGVIGVKTGFTDEAGRCLVSACERDGVRLICVTLHDPDDWQDHMQLYDYGFSQVRRQTLPVPENLRQNVVGSEKTSVSLKPQETISAGLPENGLDVTFRVILARFSYAPVAEGDVLGTLEYIYEGSCIASVPLCAAEEAACTPVSPAGPLIQFKEWLKGIFLQT